MKRRSFISSVLASIAAVPFLRAEKALAFAAPRKMNMMLVGTGSVYGVSPFAAANQKIRLALARQNFQLKYYCEGAVPGAKEATA